MKLQYGAGNEHYDIEFDNAVKELNQFGLYVRGIRVGTVHKSMKARSWRADYDNKFSNFESDHGCSDYELAKAIAKTWGLDIPGLKYGRGYKALNDENMKFQNIEFISPQPHKEGHLYTLCIRGINVGNVLHDDREWVTRYDDRFNSMDDISEPSARKLAKRVGEQWFGSF